jgi:hypothetical protein
MVASALGRSPFLLLLIPSSRPTHEQKLIDPHPLPFSFLLPPSRQEMFSLSPPLLALHLQRSTFLSPSSLHASKNPCHVAFPEYLDLAPFETNGRLSLKPDEPISSTAGGGVLERLMKGSNPLGDEEKPDGVEGVGEREKVEREERRTTRMYRLASAIFHLGSHHSGHYITYRRAPSHPSSSSFSSTSSSRWMRISDDDVLPLRNGIQGVFGGPSAKGDAFMLFYERVDVVEEQEKGGGEEEEGGRKGRIVWAGKEGVEVGQAERTIVGKIVGKGHVEGVLSLAGLEGDEGSLEKVEPEETLLAGREIGEQQVGDNSMDGGSSVGQGKKKRRKKPRAKENEQTGAAEGGEG